MDYYGPDLARVHHLGYDFQADRCAPGILELLELMRGGLVLELGCGSGLLTRHLLDAGHRVIATDGSPAMVQLARDFAPEAEDTRVLVLPDDPLPPADAVVSVGHVLNYLPDERAIDRALVAAAAALRPGGLLAIDLCDIEYGTLRRDDPPHSEVSEDWALVTRFSLPSPNRFVREMTAFVRSENGSWRRDDERHANALIEISKVPELLGRNGVAATIEPSFGDETLPTGLFAAIGRRTPD